MHAGLVRTKLLLVQICLQTMLSDMLKCSKFSYRENKGLTGSLLPVKYNSKNIGIILLSCTLVLSLLPVLAQQNQNVHPRPVAQDLAGFWDMLQLSIENISLKFDELHQLKANNWRPLDPPERKV